MGAVELVGRYLLAMVLTMAIGVPVYVFILAPLFWVGGLSGRRGGCMDRPVEPLRNPRGEPKQYSHFQVECPVCHKLGWPGRNPSDAVVQAMAVSGFKRTQLGMMCPDCAAGKGEAVRLQ